MKELYQAIKDESEKEFVRIFDGEPNNSDHESYAYILEGFELTNVTRAKFYAAMTAFWDTTTGGNYALVDTNLMKRQELTDMLDCAIKNAAWWVKLAATVKKATDTLNNRTDEEE